MKPLTIGKVAQLAEVGIETIRFYEREGLIAEPPRRESGYRQYPVGAVARLRFIRLSDSLLGRSKSFFPFALIRK